MHKKKSNWTDEGTNIKPIRCILIQELSEYSAHFSTQPSASSTHRSNSSLLACCFPSWYLRVVAFTCCVEYHTHNLLGESCVLVIGRLQSRPATFRELSGYDIWKVEDQTVLKVVFIAKTC